MLGTSPNSFYHRKEVDEKTWAHFCYLQYLFSQSRSVIVFLYTVHLFNPFVSFLAIVSAVLILCANMQKQWMEKRIIGLKMCKKNENRMWLKTHLLQETVSLSLSVPFCLLLLQPLFCDDLGACSNSLFPPFYQFKFPMSPIDFGKPCFSSKHGLSKSSRDTEKLNW